jgi:hypothetical protein
MLAQLLSSKPKSKLINLLLAYPRRSFSFTELRYTTGISSLFQKKTLKELLKIDFLTVTEKNRRKYFQINKHFPLYPELINMLRKTQEVPADLLSKAASRVGECKLVVLTGVFAAKPRMESDILIVGKVSQKKLGSFLYLAEKFAEQEVSYSVFSNHEFDYRLGLNDRFIKNILENDPVVVIDKGRIVASQK